MRRIAITFNRPEKLAPYEQALKAVSVEPVHNPNSLAGLDGLLLTGGTDVDPRLYGEEPGPHTQAADPDRDERERGLLLEALDKDLPVLAICRGLQLFNVVHGGSLIQDLPNAAVHRAEHPISVAGNTLLARLTGSGVRTVNSRHHQAAARLGDDLLVSATAEDGVVEGLERPDKKFAIAVQWHPEDRILIDPLDLALFQAFANALKQ